MSDDILTITIMTAGQSSEETQRYPFRDIESRWRNIWVEKQIHRADDQDARPKYFVLVMFPYPSGSGLHVGHCKNYVPGDVVARYQSMRGHKVLNPMGWDAFGQPAEQDAIARGVNPKQVVPALAQTYRRQLDILGVSYDWSREINSTDPAYYRWNQWIFLQLLKHGLAYRDFAPVNWCENESTVLANEEVVNGCCWRCGGPVRQKPLPQWKLAITRYADRLLAGLDQIDWPEGVKTQQRDWIGRSEGAEVDFTVEGPTAQTITVFTTRPDTLWGATFLVLAPEHPLVAQITTPEQKTAVDTYVASAAKASEQDRTAENRPKTGVFTGATAQNPVNGDSIPIWIADYVLTGYGTGAIMAVPAHDQRDFEFARKFDLPVRLVYRQSPDQTDDSLDAAFAEGGTFREDLGPAQFHGLPNDKSTTVPVVLDALDGTGYARRRVNYRLRDWLLSRQRYWGTPIPIIHCPQCGIVPVPEDQLPVLLPDVDNYRPGPDGRSPLASIPEFVHTTCPDCGQPAERETDTMAGSVDSSWYFLRFTDPHNPDAPFDKANADRWMPIDMYIGGREHAVGHLLYCRFFTRFLHDIGMCDTPEPAHSLRNQGMLNALTPVVAGTDKAVKPTDFLEYPRQEWIAAWESGNHAIPARRKVRQADGSLGEEDIEVDFAWLKMSKSKGTSVTPDEMAEKYGADTLRLYILFEAPFEDTIQWSEERMNGTFRFLNRLWDTVSGIADATPVPAQSDDPAARDLQRKVHQTIAKVGDSIENLRFNTAVSALMILLDHLRKFVAGHGHGHPAAHDAARAMVHLLAPMAPHVADELHERLGGTHCLYRGSWPQSDPALAAEDSVTVVVQVNGKLRDKLDMPAAASAEDMEAAARACPKVAADLEGKTVRKVVVVPGKLVNFVAN